MASVSEKITRCAISLALAGLTVFLGYFVQRTDFVPFIAAYGVFFGLYVWLIFFRKNRSKAEVRWYVALGIALRILLLFSIPNLSDDFYRFLWDGHLTVAGIHPFAHPPGYFVENQIFPKGITPELFSKLNSPQYFTVYPPVCQAVFALAAWLGGNSIWLGVFVMKLFLLGCEVGTVWLLAVGVNPTPCPSPTGRGGVENVVERSAASVAEHSTALLPVGEGLTPTGVAYALNPLIILEITGNCHFEGAMIFFLLAGLRALEQQKVKQSALWWALATASKLLPLMFLPVLWRWLGWRKGMVFSALFAGLCLILFVPLWSVLPNILSSLDLYFQKFQFNASFYYLFRVVGFWIKGFDIGESLGPVLGLATVAGVLVLALLPLRARFDNFSKVVKSVPGLERVELLLFALMLQLSLSATVHPWYATVPFAIGLLTHWRFPIIWTGLIALSYSHYAGGLFQENYWLIALEYSTLWLYILWESVVSRRS